MIRFLTCCLFLAFCYIVSLPQWAFHAIYRKSHPEKSAKMCQTFVVWAMSTAVKISGTNVIVKGLENVPEDQPVLYVGNHRSIFDIIIGYKYVKNNTGFVAKDSLEHVPLISRWMRYINCLFLNRTDIKEGLKTILRAIELVKQETSIFIFPEGTRCEDEELLEFKEGSLKIAEKSGCPVIPVAITGTEDIFEKHFPRIKKCTIVYEFGKPIDLKSLDRETRHHSGAYVRQIITDMRKNHENIIAKS